MPQLVDVDSELRLGIVTLLPERPIMFPSGESN